MTIFLLILSTRTWVPIMATLIERDLLIVGHRNQTTIYVVYQQFMSYFIVHV
jgi:hypothetical protein